MEVDHGASQQAVRHLVFQTEDHAATDTGCVFVCCWLEPTEPAVLVPVTTGAGVRPYGGSPERLPLYAR